MRINVYAEEITWDTEIITKEVVPEGQTEPVTFYGIRGYLKSPPELHFCPGDDDRSAITFWVPWTKAQGNDFSRLTLLFTALQDRTCEAQIDELKKRGMFNAPART